MKGKSVLLKILIMNAISFIDELTGILVPLGICVVLPVLIIWIIFRSVTNKDNKNAEIIIKAIESNTTVDVDQLVEAIGKKKRSPRQILQNRLLRGCIMTFSGIAVGIYCIISSISLSAEDFEDINFFILVACVLLAIGIAYLVVYFLTRKSIDDDKCSEE